MSTTQNHCTFTFAPARRTKMFESLIGLSALVEIEVMVDGNKVEAKHYTVLE